MTETFVPIANIDEWHDWWAENCEALDPDLLEERAFRLACNQSLMIGGGAAPLFRVGFVDD